MTSLTFVLAISIFNLHAKKNENLTKTSELFELHSQQIKVRALREVITGQNEVLAKVIFSQASVIHSVHRGGWSGLIRGGACSKFSGGCLLQIFGGGVPAPNFRGGACSKFSGGSLIFGIWSTFGRYASYWNASC